jgi:hypothetical protein
MLLNKGSQQQGYTTGFNRSSLAKYNEAIERSDYQQEQRRAPAPAMVAAKQWLSCGALGPAISGINYYGSTTCQVMKA